jgi:hypothetical protein
MTVAITHYFDVVFAKHLNPSGYASKIVSHIHGIKKRHGLDNLAIDFPFWRSPKPFMRAQMGHVVRLLGTQETLTQFLKNSLLPMELLTEGITLHGIMPIPEEIKGYAMLKRNHRIFKLEKLLRTPGAVFFDKSIGQAKPATYEMALALGLPVEQVAEVERLQNQLQEELRSSIELKLFSQSSSRNFTLCLERSIVSKPATSLNFSSYGLSLDEANVPHW